MRPLILINDIHGDTRTPAGRKDDWWAAIRGKLEQVLTVAVRLNAAAICIAGDLFHAKTRQLGIWPNGTHEVVSFYLDWARRAHASDIDVLVIPGNHDEVFDRLDSVERQPLGALLASGLFCDVSYKGVEIGGWWVSGVPYPDALDLANLKRVPAPPTYRLPGLLMLHCFAEKRGGEFFGEPVHAYSDVRVPGVAFYHYGHDHSDHGIVKTETGETHIQIGALGRGSLSGDEVNRAPQLAVLRIVDGKPEAQAFRLKVAPAEDVFNFEAKARRDAETNVIAEFVTHLDTLTIQTADELPKQISALDLPPDIHKRVEEYLDRAQHEGA